MKTKILLAAALATAALAPVAGAETLGIQTIEVAVPTDISDPAVAETYTADLLRAVSRVCARETGPVIGIAYYTYRACVAQTRVDTAHRDPTGLLAKQLGLDSAITLAAR